MAVILESFPFMEFPLSISRQDAFPLDRYSVFSSLSEAQTYAQTSPVAYVGQILAVLDNGTATFYGISNITGALTPLSGGGGTGGITSPEINTIRVMSREDYDALETPDPMTEYLILG